MALEERMKDEIAQLQTQLNQLSDELRIAQRTIRKLENRSAWRPRMVAVIAFAIASALGVGTWTTHAFSGNEARTSMLPATVQQPLKVKAPFEVVDDAGKTIMRVQDRDAGGPKEGALGRGAYIYDDSAKAVVDLTSSTAGGGRIRVTSASDDQTFVVMAAAAETTAMQVTIGGKRGVLIGRDQGKDAVVQVYNASEKPAASLERHGEGGAINVYGSGDKPVATLQSDAGDGKLWVNDKNGQQVAGVFAKDNGGVVKVMKSGDANTYTTINAIDGGLGLMVRKGGAKKAFVGTSGDSGEKGSIFVYGSGDNPIAGITSYGGGKGMVAVYSQTAAIAFLAESDKHAGGGSITATDPAGNGVFSAGYTGDGGDVCVDHKNSLKCLGVGLPLQIQK
jgi:hypothetical protein